MENIIAQMLEDEIKKTLNEVAQSKTGSDEAKAALAKLDRLHAERINELEAELKDNQRLDAKYAKLMDDDIRKAELNQRVKQAEMEIEIKQAELDQKDAELKEARRGRWWRTALDLLGIGAPIVASAYWMRRGLQFEEEGKVYTSRTGQWLSNHLRLFGKKG